MQKERETKIKSEDLVHDFAMSQLYLSNGATYDPDGCEVLDDLRNLNFRDGQTCVNSLLEVAQQQHSLTKEILAYHVQGCYFVYKKKMVEAMASFEKAMDLARKSDNQIALAIVGFDYIKACHIKHKWGNIHATLVEIEKIYQELDLVDEKIHVMIHLADYYRCFGALEQAQKMLHLASNLHSNFSEMSNYSHKVSHYIYLKLLQAQLDKKKKHPALAIETINSLAPLLEDNVSVGLELSHKQFYWAQTYLLLGECYIETGQREKSFANLNHLKKFLEKTPDPVLSSKYHVLRTTHELFFETKRFKTELWIEYLANPLSMGDVEFCLDNVLRALNKYHEHKEIESHEHLVDYYQGLMDSIGKRLPQDLVQGFVDYYEFKHAVSLKASANWQMRKYIDFSRVLISEHRLDVLSHRAMQLLADLTRMERGFMLLFDSTSPRIAATHNMSEKQLDIKDSAEAACADLAKNVLKSGHSFVRTDLYNHDLFQITTNESALLSRINQAEYIILPLMVGSDGIGLVYLDSSKARSHIKDGSDVEVLENLTSVIAFAINNTYQQTAKETDLKSVKKLLDKHKNELEIQKYSYENFIGISEKKRELFVTLQKTLDSTATITLTGESGVGKELIAKMIHYNGIRKSQSFVALNCAAIPENLLESELFGYTRGAFTGANEDKDGLFVQADKGTLFLDEIGEMPLSMQVKLIRVLQEREVTPVGGAEVRHIDVRIICATNRNLEEMVRDGAFREDLYYRINVVNINIPSLRERREDIPLIVDHALRMYAIENGVPQKTISTQAMKFLMMYPWPGNVRELINVMYNLSIFVESSTIELKDLESRQELFRSPIDMNSTPEGSQTDLNVLSNAIDEQELTLSEAKSEFERLQIERALKLYNGQITSASYHLQMPRPQVSRLVKKYGLKEA